MPDMAGKAVTVNGPVDPGELGPALMHEHLFCDIAWWNPPPPDPTPEDMELWEARLTLENLYLARAGKAIRDNFVLDDELLAIAEASKFQEVGGRTIVDVTNIGCGRNPQGVKRVADATGLNVVMGSGWYQKASHPPDMDQRTPEDLAEEIIRDITVGVGETGVRSGIIGEVGINGNPITPNEVQEPPGHGLGKQGHGRGHLPPSRRDRPGSRFEGRGDTCERGGRSHADHLRPQRIVCGRPAFPAGAPQPRSLRAVRPVGTSSRAVGKRPQAARPGSERTRCRYRHPGGGSHPCAHRRRVRRAYPAVTRRVFSRSS